MGVAASQPGSYKPGSQSAGKFTFVPTEGIYFHNEQDLYTKSRLLEAIKKGDLFLFQFTMQQNHVKPTEILGLNTDRKSVLHFLAEYNFAVGMDLVLDHIYKICPGEAPYIINSRDGAGNTSLIICCLYNSVETLEVLLKSEQVDANVKNTKGETGLAIALDQESACAKILSIYLTKESSTMFLKGEKRSINTSNLTISTQMGSPYKLEDEIVSPLSYLEPPKSLISENSCNNYSERLRVHSSSRLNNLIENLKDARTWFMDEEFPHDNLSLTGDDYLSEHFGGSNIIKWARPEVFMGTNSGNIRLFDKLQVNDVSTSPIAGCDFYVVLAKMTEFPQRLVKVFTTTEVNRFGAYSINFLVCGISIEIMLDDYFPCFKASNQLAFSRIKSNELWFSLLEKGAAKLYGSYSEVDAINMIEAFELVTGMPSAQHNFEDHTENEIWNMLTEFNQRTYLICAGFYQDQTFTRSCHSSIVGVYKANGLKMVKLKLQYENGDEYWKYFEKPKKWTKEFKEEVCYFENEKDCFYMEIKELIEQFDFISVCYYHENWIRQRLDIKSGPKDVTYFEFTIEKPTEMFIAIHQKSPNFVDEGPEYRLSPVEIALAQDLGHGLRCIGNGPKEPIVESTTYISDKIRLQLPEGKYVVRARVRWVDDEEHTFSISTLAPTPIALKQVGNDVYPNFLERVYTDLALRSRQKFSFNYDCKFVSALTGTDLWVCAINEGDRTWNLEIFFELSEGLKIKKKYKATDNSIKLKILPGRKEVGIIKRLIRGIVGFKWRLVHSWEPESEPSKIDWDRLTKRTSIADSSPDSVKGIEI